MTESENETLIHQTRFERYKNSQVKKALKVLTDANKSISDKIKETKGIWTKERYREIAKYLKEASRKASEDYQNITDIEELLTEEIEAQCKILVKGIKADVTFRLPGLKQLKEAVLFSPIEALNHKTYEETFAYFAENLYSTWDSAVRTGYLTGLPTPEIVKTVMGSVTGFENPLKPNRVAQLRKSVELNTRTILQGFADEAHRAVFKENEGSFLGYKILATLDRRTCVVCASLERKVYKSLSDVPPLPIHYNCRCVLVPVTAFDREFSGTRASESGPVEDMGYEKWLRMQSEEVQREILGGRYEFYKKNQSLEKQFFNNNGLMTIKELREKNGK